MHYWSGLGEPVNLHVLTGPMTTNSYHEGAATIFTLNYRVYLLMNTHSLMLYDHSIPNDDKNILPRLRSIRLYIDDALMVDSINIHPNRIYYHDDGARVWHSHGKWVREDIMTNICGNSIEHCNVPSKYYEYNYSDTITHKLLYGFTTSDGISNYGQLHIEDADKSILCQFSYNDDAQIVGIIDRSIVIRHLMPDKPNHVKYSIIPFDDINARRVIASDISNIYNDRVEGYYVYICNIDINIYTLYMIDTRNGDTYEFTCAS